MKRSHCNVGTTGERGPARGTVTVSTILHANVGAHVEASVSTKSAESRCEGRVSEKLTRRSTSRQVYAVVKRLTMRMKRLVVEEGSKCRTGHRGITNSRYGLAGCKPSSGPRQQKPYKQNLIESHVQASARASYLGLLGLNDPREPSRTRTILCPPGPPHNTGRPPAPNPTRQP